MPIGRLEHVELRELWPNEARDFTTWLAENIEFLGDALGMDGLSLLEQEGAAGAFSPSYSSTLPSPQRWIKRTMG